VFDAMLVLADTCGTYEFFGARPGPQGVRTEIVAYVLGSSMMALLVISECLAPESGWI
jgi:hypothetical protein